MREERHVRGGKGRESVVLQWECFVNGGLGSGNGNGNNKPCWNGFDSLVFCERSRRKGVLLTAVGCLGPKIRIIGGDVVEALGADSERLSAQRENG